MMSHVYYPLVVLTIYTILIMTNELQEAIKRSQADIRGRLDGTFQRQGVEWMLSKELQNGTKGGILADDMGLGKTMQAIACMRGNPKNTLVVTMVGLVNQWKDALCDFGGYKPMVLNASYKSSIPKNIEVVITAYSSFQKQCPSSCLYEKDWGRIILDEGHFIKNPLSKTSIEISKLRCGIKWVLSGTPIQNTTKDLLTLAKWIGFDTAGIPIEDVVSQLVLRRTQEEMSRANPRMALPSLETNVVYLDFATKEEEAFYSSVEEFYSERAVDKPTEAMTSLMRCRQACTNPMVYMKCLTGTSTRSNKRDKKRKSSTRDVPKWLHQDILCTKVKYIVEDIVAHHKKQKCLVFCTWLEEMSSIARELESQDVSSLIYDGGMSRENKEAALYNFKNTDIPVLILQINCGSTGLNLQCASRVYLTSANWNPCIDLQAIGRAYRKGQEHVVTCIRIIMKGTVEERCLEIQDAKMALITSAMKDDSLANRLGALTKMDDVNVVDIFKSNKRTKTTLVNKEELVSPRTLDNDFSGFNLQPKHHSVHVNTIDDNDEGHVLDNQLKQSEEGDDVPKMFEIDPLTDDDFMSFLDSLLNE